MRIFVSDLIDTVKQMLVEIVDSDGFAIG